MIDVAFTTLAFVVIFVLVEILAAKYKTHADITRKIAHILSGIIVFFIPLFLTKIEIISISVFFVIGLLITKSLNLIKSVHSVDRKTLGEIFFPLGVIFCALFFLPHDVEAFQFGILVMALSDAMAALVGIPLGKHSFLILKSKKSLEGSFAFFITSVVIWLSFYKNIDFRVLLIPAVLTFVELVLVFGLDNLVLPSLAAYLFSVLR